jgi:hypothetical protein
MKISYSQLLNIVLVTILVSSVFFMNTRSTIETKTANAGTYDPWLDYNEDGYVGIDDIYTTAQGFGAEGDPTKNVNVTNNSNAQHLGLLNVSWNDYGETAWAGFPSFSCAGYDEMYVYAEAVNAKNGVYNCTIFPSWTLWSAKVPILGQGRWEWQGTDKLIMKIWVNGASLSGEAMDIIDNAAIKVKGAYYQLIFSNRDPTIQSGWIQIDVYVYLAKR